MQPRLDDPFRITLSVTERCNLRCVHCYSDCNRRASARDLPFDAWRRIVEDALASGVIKVFFEGGEPLMRDDFLDLVALATPHALTYVRSNGTLIDEATAKAFAELKVGTVCLDLLGARAETHDALTGEPGSFALTCAAAKRLREAGLPVILLCILMRPNAAELPAYLELARALGVDKVSILRLYPLGRARKRWRELALSLDEMTAALAPLAPPKGMKLMQSWHPNDPNCCWQNTAVRADGRSIGCPYLREYVDFGDLGEIPLAESWRHPLHVQLRRHAVDGACADCSATQRTFGGCRATAYAFTGDFAAPDPFCPRQNGGIDLRELPRRPPVQG